MHESSIVAANGLPAIGAYTLSNTGGLLIHAIEDERVLVSLNGKQAEWCERAEQICVNDDGEYDMVDGFKWGELLIPLSEVMRI